MRLYFFLFALALIPSAVFATQAPTLEEKKALMQMASCRAQLLESLQHAQKMECSYRDLLGEKMVASLASMGKSRIKDPLKKAELDAKIAKFRSPSFYQVVPQNDGHIILIDKRGLEYKTQCVLTQDQAKQLADYFYEVFVDTDVNSNKPIKNLYNQFFQDRICQKILS